MLGYRCSLCDSEKLTFSYSNQTVSFRIFLFFYIIESCTHLSSLSYCLFYNSDNQSVVPHHAMVFIAPSSMIIPDTEPVMTKTNT